MTNFPGFYLGCIGSDMINTFCDEFYKYSGLKKHHKRHVTMLEMHFAYYFTLSIICGFTTGCYVFPDDQRDPCIGKLCSYGAQCMPSLDGLTARCLCPEHCDTFGDNVGSTPICGTDGNDYNNLCEMRRASCREMKDIEKKFDGHCDPCDGHLCPASLICLVDENRQPKCSCSSRCTDEFSPVCGSDGKTYANDCSLRVQACRSRHNITVMFRGDCSSGNNLCISLRCHDFEECHIQVTGQAKCVCPVSCEKIYRPVCGNNGRTYDNRCELRQHLCLHRINIDISYNGICNLNSPCSTFKCSYNAICSVAHGKAFCQCPSCPEYYEPICGSDGITYGNECKMLSSGCQQQKHITISSRGHCNGCENMKCDYYSICESDGKSGGRCVCPVTCIQVEDRVCGTDGVTYTNECELQVASCWKQQLIIISSVGSCDYCDQIKCSYGAVCKNNKCQCQMHCPSSKEPVCASDGVSYFNECAMHRAACQRGVTLEVMNSGECEELSSSGSLCDETTCKYGGTCVYDTEGEKGCQCLFYCNTVRSPVCGSDGRLYNNECQMKEESCQKQQEIFSLPFESCQDTDEEFCEGNLPLTDLSTGIEYNCDGTKERCPAGSYCHKLAAGSKCCMEDQYMRNCKETTFGCCPDGRTAALGSAHAGCPSICLCNLLGSYGKTCDPNTRQCTCKPGVGGLRCDRCEPNFWGLSKIAEGNSGCIPCGCNLFGSVRNDCEQTTGRCICKQHVTGQKCNICANGKELGPQGCIGVTMLGRTEQSTGSCAELECRYNAVCQLNKGVAECICPSSCHLTNLTQAVCGTDGITYASACHLRLTACRLQKDTLVAHYGSCQEITITSGAHENISDLTYDYRVSKSASKLSSHETIGYVGDDCWSGKDCHVPNSFCRMWRCACGYGFGPSATRKICRRNSYIPSFSGMSYIQLKRLQHGSHEISIEIEFRPFRNDGILLYIGQNDDGKGDFITLYLRAGFVDFRYDLGSGPATVTTSERVTINHLQKVTAKRFGREGLLRLNDGPEVSGTSPGLLKSLNLGDPFYLGNIANFTDLIIRNIGTTQGFFGCIESLKIDSSELSHAYDLNFQFSSPDIVTNFQTDECGHYPCDNKPCLNGGTCVHLDSIDFHCQCVEGYIGAVCEDKVLFSTACDPNPCFADGTCHGISNIHFYCICQTFRTGSRCETDLKEQTHHLLSNISIPQFQNTSYLEIKLTKNVGRSLAFELWFLTISPNGVLLYSSQEGTSKGDFFSLNLVNGYVQLRYNLGSGIANITSSTAVNLYSWTQVSVFRVNQFGSVSVNAGTPSRGYSDGDLKELNLPMTLYLGGYPGEYNPQAGVVSGLLGAVQRFYEDGVHLESFMAEAVSHHKISQYGGPPCPLLYNPCLRNITCHPHLNDFECPCPKHFTGKKCEISLQHLDISRPMAFDGRLFHRYRNTISRFEKSQTTNSYEILFQTSSTQGLLLLQHKSNTVHTDYLAIALNEGRVEVSLNLGKEVATDLLVVRAKNYVIDKAWHTLTFFRDKRLATIQIDSGPPVTILSTPGATQLDTDGTLWIGGSKSILRGLPEAYYMGFNGCIKYVKINNRTLDLLMDRANHDKVEFCD